MDIIERLEYACKNEHSLDLNIDSDKFIEIFNYIGNTVSKKEYQKNKNADENYIGNKIYKEVLNYLMKNKDDMLNKNIFKKQQIINLKTDTDPVLKKKWCYITEEETPINLDVKNIKITDVEAIKHSFVDYNVNKTNDTLVIREKIQGGKDLYTEEKIITLEHGIYNLETLITELTFKFSKQSLNHKYFFYTDNITFKFAISTLSFHGATISMLRDTFDENTCVFEIINEKSNVLGLLGFDHVRTLKESPTYISDTPINLNQIIKPRDRITISFDDFYHRDLILKDTTSILLEEEFKPYENIKTLKINKHHFTKVSCIAEILYYVK